jgi:endonuclease/exonuclease/phosphatase (EEP) superfamily protein YafD
VFRRLLVGLPVAAVAAVVLGPELFGLADSAPFVQFVAFQPVLATVLLLLMALTVLVRRRWWPVALLPAVVAAVALGAVAPRAVAGPPPPAGTSLTVLSFNVFTGRADPAALAATMRTVRPDLVVLPEAGQRYQRGLTPLLAGLGYRSWVTTSAGEPDSDGIVVLASARLGNLTGRPLVLDTKRRWMTLTGGGLGDLTLVAVHTAAPVRDLPGWAAELGDLRQWCTEGFGPHLVVGDLNATLDHAPLRAATAGCTDAAAARGEGLVATWPTRWPRWLGVQIDHVFTSGGPVAASLQVLDLPGSDHRALLTRIVLPGA